MWLGRGKRYLVQGNNFEKSHPYLIAGEAVQPVEVEDGKTYGSCQEEGGEASQGALLLKAILVLFNYASCAKCEAAMSRFQTSRTRLSGAT